MAQHRMARSGRWSSVGLLGVVLLLASLVLLQTQVEVVGASDPDGRTCGSALDALTGRSGWQEWWSADLDDQPAEQPSPLTRTEHCPDAINRHLWMSSLLGVVGVFGLGAASWSRRPEDKVSGGMRSVRRFGTSIAVTGTLLTVGGVVALVALVADPSSTLFIYVDRLVVALIGLIVLVPAVALMAIGRVIMLVGERIPEEPRQP